MRILFYQWLLVTIFSMQVFMANGDCSCENFSQSYFSVRPQFKICSPEYTALGRGWLSDECCNDYGFDVRAVLFGGESTKRNRLGTFFSPECSPSFIVNSTIAENSTNLLPQNFNIFSVQFSPALAALLDIDNITIPFMSKVTLKPRQSVVGLGLRFRKEFCMYGMRHWISVSGPIERVQTTMGLEENILQASQVPGETFYNVTPIPNQTNNLNTPFRSMTDALAQDAWKYGKIDNKKRHKTKLAFIQIQVGNISIENECCHLEPYIGVTIPTGNSSTSEFVFEPIVGQDGHYGVLWGASGGFRVGYNDCRDMALDFEVETVMEYQFKKTRKRSVDLRNRPWSRYIETYATRFQSSQANTLAGSNRLGSIFLNTPGINTLTVDVSINPGFNFTSNMALVMSHCPYGCGTEFEFGYNFYARQAECLSLKRGFSTTAAIKDSAGMGVTNPVRDITANQLLNEASILNLQTNGNLNTAGIAAAYSRGIITQDDLNLASAAHPSMLSHTLYGAFGYHCNTWCYPVNMSIGGSYEFNRKLNATMDRWLVWGTLGVSF